MIMFGGSKEVKGKVYIDLEDRCRSPSTGSPAGIKIVEVMFKDDLKELEEMVRQGNVMVLDFSRFTDGYGIKKDMSKRLFEVANEMNNLFIEISDRLTVISASGLAMEKYKIAQRRK